MSVKFDFINPYCYIYNTDLHHPYVYMIPDFDHNHVIPPHIGTPTSRAQLSPYITNSLEFCKTFATSKERIEILKGYISFREKLNEIGIINGFQWLDGSFTESVEIREKRAPRDLDLVTFFIGITPIIEAKVMAEFIEYIDPEMAKKKYNLDHYIVDYGFSPETTIDETRYWLQLFSHNRLGVWKGILKIELNTPSIDQEAKEFLEKIIL